MKINGDKTMSDRKPVIIAIAVGSLALAANGAAAVIAISASSAPPQAAIFGITGLTAAFIGLIATIIWAFSDDVKPARRERVFTPWSEHMEQAFTRPLEPTPAPRSSLALARQPLPAAMAEPASEGRVVYIADWLKAHGAEHANA
jgi:hypothetical protein